MPEENEKVKKMEDRIAKLEAQQKQLKAKKRALRNRISQQNRKVRTKRLIEKGAILEKFQGAGADKISADDSLTALVQLQNDFDSLKAFTSNVKYRKNNPDEPTRTVYDNWEEQKNQN